MSLTLSAADTQRIIDVLFLLKSPAPTPLAKPTNVGGLEAKLDPIGADPRFKNIGFAVVDFTASMTTPKVWLHNGDDAWRVGSTGKIAALLAAAQLRDDVRNVKALNIISSPADFDELFSTIWLQSSNSLIKQIAEAGSSPRISTIFDLTQSPPDFLGANVALDKGKLKTIGENHLSWAGAPDLTFWERLWLTGAQSDNVATTSCISDIGVAYMKAVQRAYGLFDEPNGMHFLLAAGYAGVDTSTPVNRTSGAPKYRGLRNFESHRVKDAYYEKNKKGDLVASYYSTEPGSAAALTAYMLALMGDTLVSKDGCDSIRAVLADETQFTTTSLIYEGVDAISTVTKAHTKLGILGALRCEFAYIEAGTVKFAVLATGILPVRVGSTSYKQVKQGQDLGAAIYNALSTP